MNRIKYLAIAASLMVSSIWAQEQTTFEIRTGGTYSYFPSGEGYGIPGCSPNEYQCDFGVQGTFTLEENSLTNSASIVAADIELIGNDGITFADWPLLLQTTGVEDWLESLTLTRVVSTADERLWQAQISGSDLTFRVAVQTVTPGAEVSGGYDFQYVDGDGIEFQFDASVVPEPGGFFLISLCAMLFVPYLRRPRTKYRVAV